MTGKLMPGKITQFKMLHEHVMPVALHTAPTELNMQLETLHTGQVVARIRVRETHGKASIFLTAGDLDLVIAWAQELKAGMIRLDPGTSSATPVNPQQLPSLMGVECSMNTGRSLGMQIKKHHLPLKPLLKEWLSCSVPKPGMLVWLEGRAYPILIGDITTIGDGSGASRLDHARVVAYAQVPINELEVVDA